MTPVEAATVAIDRYADSLPETSDFRGFLRSHKRGVATAIILALAECDLPEDTLKAVEDAVDDCRADEFMDVAFKAMLRSIANEGKTDG